MFQPISGGGHVIPCILGVVSQHCVSVVGMLVHVRPKPSVPRSCQASKNFAKSQPLPTSNFNTVLQYYRFYLSKILVNKTVECLRIMVA